MTPEEKQSELKRYRDILLATLEYHIVQFKVGEYGGEDRLAFFQQLKKQVEENYQKGRLSILKQWFRDMSEGPRETRDLNYCTYIREKTGYDIDIFKGFQERIEKIINRKRIRSANEYRDVLQMVDNLCQQKPFDAVKVAILNKLLIAYDEKITGRKISESNAVKQKNQRLFIRKVFEIPSPDQKRMLTINEFGIDETDCSTQVTINFRTSGAGVYGLAGINHDINAYWKDDNTIVIETRKDLKATQKWERVQSFQNVIKVEYIES